MIDFLWMLFLTIGFTMVIFWLVVGGEGED